MEQFYDGKQDVLKLRSGDTHYIANFITNHEKIMKQIGDEVVFLPREELTFKIFGKENILPRDKQFYGDITKDGVVPLYKYSGGYIPKIHDWVSVVRNIRDSMHKVTSQYCNYAVVNRYLNGSDYIGLHKDKDRDFVAGSSVMTVTLGCPRVFELKHIENSTR